MGKNRIEARPVQAVVLVIVMAKTAMEMEAAREAATTETAGIGNLPLVL